jgi:hypothetical protein
MDLVVGTLNPPGLAPVASGTRRALSLLSPHYNLARGLYDVHSSYSAGGPLALHRNAWPGFSLGQPVFVLFVWAALGRVLHREPARQRAAIRLVRLGV